MEVDKKFDKTFYKKHVFICTNQREASKNCCNNHKADEVVVYTKQKIAELGLAGKGKIRVTSAGCLGRCAEGPVLVIYPESVWYTYKNSADIDQIIQEHLVEGRQVDRLRLVTHV